MKSSAEKVPAIPADLETPERLRAVVPASVGAGHARTVTVADQERAQHAALENAGGHFRFARRAAALRLCAKD